MVCQIDASLKDAQPYNSLVIGGGGREHALAWKLSTSVKINKVFVAPGNGGTGSGECSKIQNIPIAENDFDALLQFSQQNQVKLVIVGPEQPLVDGITERFKSIGISVFGPSKQAALLEASKAFAKDFMSSHGIPTARYQNFQDFQEAANFIESIDYRVVIKASGLAAGKGVLLPATKAEALEGLRSMMCDHLFGSSGDQVVIEEFLEGDEYSVLAFTDGYSIACLPPSQDHKRIFERDMGPNTGGMGAYAPVPWVTEDMMKVVQEKILKPTVDGMRRSGAPYIGLLYAGIMMTKQGPYLLEYNCRFGDPETQVVLPLLSEECDFADLIEACVSSKLDSVNITFKKQHAATIVLVSRGYPGKYAKNFKITIPQISLNDQFIFHAGTKMSPENHSQLVTNGGRVLAITALGSDLKEAIHNAYTVVDTIHFEGMQYRRDIGQKGLIPPTFSSVPVTYADSGVSVDNGNRFVDVIKPLAKKTARIGCDAELGGFGGMFDLKAAGFDDPVLVSSTDGVGTKLLIAQAMNSHSTIGIDLVAMCVNDLIVQGAEPLFFLDYFACGKLEIGVAQQVVAGIAEGCHQANCALLGGETAEMPGMYSPGHYDIAGFTVGAAHRANILPKPEIGPSDVLIGIPSSGIHSNGFSLVRHLIKSTGVQLEDPCPFSDHGTLGEHLLEPTRIYVKSLLPLVKQNLIKGMAHITGGGFIDNIPRILKDDISAVVDCLSWTLPPVFKWLKKIGSLQDSELARTFNCGIGMILVVDKTLVSIVQSELQRNGELSYVMGYLKHRQEAAPSVELLNYESWSS
eukprot:Sdes_comp15445_c0_seq1m4340